MKIDVSPNVTLYGLVGVHLRFSETCYLFFYQCSLYTVVMEGVEHIYLNI